MKKKILLSGIFYPMAILRYFEKALENMPDVQLCTIGCYTGAWIPWNGGMNLPQKYAKSPDIPLQREFIHRGSFSLKPYLNQIESFFGGSPDLFIQVDAGWHFTDSPYKTVGIATDPHCLNYDPLRKVVSTLYNMQKVYSKPNDLYLPYAYSPYYHFPFESEKEFDTGMVGLQYESRIKAYKSILSRGRTCHFSIGEIFDKYRERLSTFRSVINISSLDDLNARMFEVPAMNIPLIANEVSDTHEFFTPYEHYYPVKSYADVPDALDWILENPEKANEMSSRAFSKVRPHTYSARIKYILEDQL